MGLRCVAEGLKSKKTAAGKECRRPKRKLEIALLDQKAERAILTSSSRGAASVVFGGGGSRLALGAGVGGAPGAIGVAAAGAGAVVAQLLQVGQTHNTVHCLTGVSLVTGWIMSLCTS